MHCIQKGIMAIYKFVVLILLIVMLSVESRGIWGSKKKEKKDKKDNDIDYESSTNNIGANVGGAPAARMRTDNSISSRSKEVMRAVYSLIDTMEEMMTKKEFIDAVTPESVQQMVMQLPGAATSPEIQSVLESPAFTDPTMLKHTMTQGISQLRSYANELGSLLSDPASLDQLLMTLPSDIQRAIRGFLDGDLHAVREVLERTPGLEQNQIDMVMQVLEGDLEGMASNLKNMVNTQLSDPKVIENTRQQLLKDPKIAESLGISMDQVKDKRKWKAFVEAEKEKFKNSGAIDSGSFGASTGSSTLDALREAGLDLDGLDLDGLEGLSGLGSASRSRGFATPGAV